MTRLGCIFRAIERSTTYIGTLCLFALMFIVTMDVGARYFLSRPFVWSYDVITLYLTPALFFLVLSDSFRSGAQVNVDVLHRMLPRSVRRYTDALCNFLAFAVFALIAYAGALRAATSFMNADVTVGIVPWPTWPSAALVPLGGGMLALRLLARALADLLGTAEEASPGAHHLETQGAFE